MVARREHEAFTSPSAGNRKATRYLAAALSGLVGVLFLVLPSLMTDMEPVLGVRVRGGPVLGRGWIAGRGRPADRVGGGCH